MAIAYNVISHSDFLKLGQNHTQDQPEIKFYILQKGENMHLPPLPIYGSGLSTVFRSLIVGIIKLNFLSILEMM
jgi:hypothetical protein